MATAVLRNMTLGQNLHLVSNNCVIVSNQQTPVIMHHHGKRPIAPATEQRSHVMAQLDQNLNNKKKMSYAHMGPYATQPASVQRRNARERNRVKQVNNGFANLRQHIPADVITALTNGGRGASKKLSKVDTLKLAVEYIRRLQDLLDENDSETGSTSTHSLSSSSSYYTPSPTQHSPSIQNSIPPPPCSEASMSPTPSFISDGSNGHFYVQQPVPYKYEVHTYNECNPAEEELLDFITLWQQQ